MKCPKCGKQMEQGQGGALPVNLQYHWAECSPCGVYATAQTITELEDKLEPRERQEITAKDVGKIEDIF